IKLTRKDDGWSGEIVAPPLKGRGAVENVSVTAKLLRLTIKVPAFTLLCKINLPADKKAAKLFGETTFRKDATAIELERTTLTSLDSFDQNREALATEPLGVQAIGLALSLLRQAEEKKVKPT